MKGIRFYADIPGTQCDGEQLYPSRITVAGLQALAERKVRVNCIALMLGDEHRNHDLTQEAMVSVFGHADSGVCCGGVSREYLRKCRRIPEALARALHPQLAQRLGTADSRLPVSVTDEESAKLPGQRIKVLRRFATIPEAEAWIGKRRDKAKVARGGYGINAPEGRRFDHD